VRKVKLKNSCSSKIAKDWQNIVHMFALVETGSILNRVVDQDRF